MAPPRLGSYIGYECKHCGKHCRKWVTPSGQSRNPPVYCNRQCAGLASIKHEVPCAYCGQPFHPAKSSRFCSRKCFALSTRGRMAKNAHPQELVDAIRETFPTQGASSIAKRFGLSQVAVQNAAYTHGIKLLPEIMRTRMGSYGKTLKGARNPGWQGGITVTEWGDNWEAQRKACRQRDSFTCQVCGVYAKTVHHIIRRRLFIGHMNDSNVLSNLIVLCGRHHLLVECGKVPCPIPRP